MQARNNYLEIPFNAKDKATSLKWSDVFHNRCFRDYKNNLLYEARIATRFKIFGFYTYLFKQVSRL
jgi:hypothetical protein